MVHVPGRTSLSALAIAIAIPTPLPHSPTMHKHCTPTLRIPCTTRRHNDYTNTHVMRKSRTRTPAHGESSSRRCTTSFDIESFNVKRSRIERNYPLRNPRTFVHAMHVCAKSAGPMRETTRSALLSSSVIVNPLLIRTRVGYVCPQTYASRHTRTWKQQHARAPATSLSRARARISRANQVYAKRLTSNHRCYHEICLKSATLKP